jgi:hypothetical protein
MEPIQTEWHEYIVEDSEQFRVIPGYTFNASNIKKTIRFDRIPGKRVIIMDSIVFKLPEETYEVRVRVYTKSDDIVVEVYLQPHVDRWAALPQSPVRYPESS